MLLTLTIGTSSSSIGISTSVGASDGLGHISTKEAEKQAKRALEEALV